MIDISLLTQIANEYVRLTGIKKDQFPIHLPLTARILKEFDNKLNRLGSYREEFRNRVKNTNINNEWPDFLFNCLVDAGYEVDENEGALRLLTSNLTKAFYNLVSLDRKFHYCLVYQLSNNSKMR